MKIKRSSLKAKEKSNKIWKTFLDLETLLSSPPIKQISFLAVYTLQEENIHPEIVLTKKNCLMGQYPEIFGPFFRSQLCPRAVNGRAATMSAKYADTMSM